MSTRPCRKGRRGGEHTIHGYGRRYAGRIGPYTVLTRLDSNTPAPQPPTPERRFIARSPDGDRTVLLSAPLPKAATRGRFMAEAGTSRYLLGPWVLPATELAAPGGEALACPAHVPVRCRSPPPSP
ncbi:hypothetical protein ACRAWF_43925 [Streptomyces sp. L7]